jgi:riboflavin kinase/FMN adenylyltransferase
VQNHLACLCQNESRHQLGSVAYSGTVAHGLKNGRTIDFPTSNIPIKRKISPVHGILAVTVELNGTSYQGVCSIGNRPSSVAKKLC